jgi:hypothetical protein
MQEKMNDTFACFDNLNKDYFYVNITLYHIFYHTSHIILN